MRWTTLLLLAVVLVGLSAAKVRADNPTVTITATDNTMANKITADGSYTLPDDGTTVRDITVVVRPTGGVNDRRLP